MSPSPPTPTLDARLEISKASHLLVQDGPPRLPAGLLALPACPGAQPNPAVPCPPLKTHSFPPAITYHLQPTRPPGGPGRTPSRQEERTGAQEGRKRGRRDERDAEPSTTTTTKAKVKAITRERKKWSTANDEWTMLDGGLNPKPPNSLPQRPFLARDLPRAEWHYEPFQS